MSIEPIALGIIAASLTSSAAIEQSSSFASPRCSIEWIDAFALEQHLRIELAMATPRLPAELVSIDELACVRAEPILPIAITASASTSYYDLALGDVPRDARPRVAAIALAELLRTRAERAPLPPSVTARSPPIDHRDRIDLHAAGLVRFFPAAGAGAAPSASTIFFGARAGVGWPLATPLSLALEADASFLRASRDQAIGRVKADVAAVSIGVSWLKRDGPVALSVGPRIEGGWIWARGEPRAPSTASSPGNGPVVLAEAHGSLALELDRRWRFRLEA
jgi:hypothetical protein